MAYKTINTSDINKLSLDELAALRRKYAKAANQRMVRLERAGLTQFAYQKAQSYLYKGGKEGDKLRFTENKKARSIGQERKDIKALIDFLNKPTSTKSGIKKVYEKKYETFLKNAFNKGKPLGKKKKELTAMFSFSDYTELVQSDYFKNAQKGVLGSENAILKFKEVINKGIDANEFLDMARNVAFKTATDVSDFIKVNWKEKTPFE